MSFFMKKSIISKWLCWEREREEGPTPSEWELATKLEGIIRPKRQREMQDCTNAIYKGLSG